MRRIESDPEEQQQIADALSRAATPTHEELSDKACRSLRPAEHLLGKLVIRDPVEHGWDLKPPTPLDDVDGIL